jgi:hypothetical protein
MISERKPTELSISRAASKAFCWNLSQGLHAAAQPLTILRAGLGNARLGGMSNEEIIEPELIATPILPLLAHAAEGVDLLFKQSGVSLRTTVPDCIQPVLINRLKTLEVLSSLLLIAQATSRSGDAVEFIAASESSAAVRVVIRNLNAHVADLNMEASLGLALAEANVRSQRASLDWSLQPFTVEIVFPIAATGGLS